MYEISKTFEFSAAHALTHLPETHQCHRLHGHNYVVTFVLRREGLDENGFVQDYGELKDVKTWLDLNFDHRNLNDVLAEHNLPSTAESIARFLYDKFKKDYEMLWKVTVSETPKTTASYWDDTFHLRLTTSHANSVTLDDIVPGDFPSWHRGMGG